MKKINILIVVASFYPGISKPMINSALKYLKDIEEKAYSLKTSIKINHKIINVPGVFEIPVLIARNINRYDGIIALGCVIKGQTPHFDFISTATTNAIMYLSIKSKKPIGNGIITCLNKKQALERSDYKKKNKGGETVKAVLSVLNSWINE